jgi:histidinol phosphatase-like enzyme (inositol monophosphatase family)
VPDGSDAPSAAEVGHLLASAVEFAREAGEVTLRYFGGRVPADDKADGTPVTRADRESEGLLRDRIGARYPDHGILGEEFGEDRPDAPVRWILDPIDGTRSFMRGVPLYGVLIGIEVAGEPVVGVIHFPALGEMVSAGRGLGCRWNGEPCSVSDAESLDEALILTTDIERILSRPQGAGWRLLQQSSDFSRTWGDCYGHALVATGRADAMVDPVLTAWDASPFLTILTEAGGRFTDLTGAPTIHGGSGVSTNGRLHDRILGVLENGG